MGKLFRRRHNTAPPSRLETSIGFVILLLTVGIVVSFATISISPGKPLFQLSTDEEGDPAEARLALGMLPPLGTAGWVSPGETDGTEHVTCTREEVGSQATGFTVYRGRYHKLDDPTREVTVEVVDTQSPERAFGLYGVSVPKIETKPLPVGNGGWQTADAGAFWSGRHFVSFTRKNVGPSGPTVPVIADALASVHLAYGRPFWIESTLPEDGLISGSLRYAMDGTLDFPFLTDSFLADYEGGITVFAGRRATSAEAQAMLSHFADFLGEHGKIQSQPDQGGGAMLAGDYSKQTQQLAVFTDGESFYGVLGGNMPAVLKVAEALRDNVRPPAGPATAAASANTTEEEESPFPVITDTSWQVPDNTAIYTPLNLWQKIDGRADLYLSFGMEKMTFGTYQRVGEPSEYVDVYWYDMGSPEGAFGVYRAEYGGHVTPLTIGDEAYLSGGSIFLRKGNDYVRIEAPEDSEMYGMIVEQIAEAIAGDIKDNGEKMWAERLLPAEHQIEGSFQFHARDAFSLDFLHDVFSADYDYDGGRVTLFVYQAPDAAAATETAAKYATFFEEFGRVVSNDEGLLIGESGGVFDAVFTHDAYLCGVTGGGNAEQVERAAALLRAAMSTQ